MDQATIEKKLESLNAVRLKIPRLIPKELIELVKGRTFTPEQFYQYQESQLKNPFNYLYVFIDETRKIHGYLWAEVNSLDNTLFINTFSISKEYWDKGQAINMAKELIQNIVNQAKAQRVFWVTTNEKFFIKHGLKRSKNVLMEYNLV